VREILKIVIL